MTATTSWIRTRESASHITEFGDLAAPVPAPYWKRQPQNGEYATRSLNRGWNVALARSLQLT